MSVLLTALCSQPEAFASDLGDDQSRYLLCRPDGIGTVLREEWDKFLEVKDRMRQFLEHQITNFR